MTTAASLPGLFDQTAAVGPLPAAKTFTMEDQEAFARLSGDRNPMHMDFAIARRTQGGGCIVHGVQAMLWALERLAEAGVDIAGAEAINVGFSKFIVVGQTVGLQFLRKTATNARADIMSAGQPAVTITFKSAGKGAGSASALADLPDFELRDQPVEQSRSGIAEFAGWIRTPGSKADFEAAYPRACSILGAANVMNLAALSTLVGMACPGLNSIFSGFSIQRTEPRGERPGVGARTVSFDERARLLQIAVESAQFVGTVSAFERFPPTDASLDDIRRLVDPGEFSGRRALVIGGSRGLGAATAKLLAAGGAKVTITYFQGFADAERVRGELCAAFGPEACATAQLDIRTAPADAIAALAREITHLYYFATPLIARQRAGAFDDAAFDDFVEVYVRGFHKAVEAIAGARKGEKLSVCYPSSIFVEKRPRQMTEYAMAKAAGEVLCEELMRSFPGLSIIAPRLPRTLTDQTATVPPVETADPVETMLPQIRAQTLQPASS